MRTTSPRARRRSPGAPCGNAADGPNWTRPPPRTPSARNSRSRTAEISPSVFPAARAAVRGLDREVRAARRLADEGLLLRALDAPERVEDLGGVAGLERRRGGQARDRVVGRRAFDADDAARNDFDRRRRSGPRPPSTRRSRRRPRPGGGSRPRTSASRGSRDRPTRRRSAVSRSLRSMARFAAQARFVDGVTSSAVASAASGAGAQACLALAKRVGGQRRRQGRGGRRRGQEPTARARAVAAAAVPAAVIQRRRVRDMTASIFGASGLGYPAALRAPASRPVYGRSAALAAGGGRCGPRAPARSGRGPAARRRGARPDCAGRRRSPFVFESWLMRGVFLFFMVSSEAWKNPVRDARIPARDAAAPSPASVHAAAQVDDRRPQAAREAERHERARRSPPRPRPRASRAAASPARTRTRSSARTPRRRC